MAQITSASASRTARYGRAKPSAVTEPAASATSEAQPLRSPPMNPGVVAVAVTVGTRVTDTVAMAT